MTNHTTSQPLGFTAPANQGAGTANVIAAIEQIYGGDTLVTVGNVAILGDGTRPGRLFGAQTVRLTPDEREQLIRQLSDHRFVDLERAIGGGAVA